MKPKSKFFLYLFFLAFLLPVALYTYKHPAYNFDMLGYMALVVRLDQTNNLGEVHKIVYDNARQSLPAEEYKKLTGIPSFREKFAVDPSQFKMLLPIYAVKPLYIWMSWVFYKCGFSLTMATVMPSIVAYLIIGLFLLYWLRKYMQDIMASLAALLIMLSLFTVAVAGLSTPDCFSALFLFISTYFILEKRNTWLMFIFFLLAIFTRVDNIITCFFILTFLTFSKPWERINKKKYFLMVIFLAIAYLSIILPVTQFGWSISFYSQYARQIDFSRNFDEAVSFSSYLSLVYSKLVTALVSTHFTFFLFLALLVIGNPARALRNMTFDQSFLLLLLSIILFRFLLLPDLSDRFYFGFYLVIIMLLIRKFSALISTTSYEDR